jgi:hypothetical protein
MGLVKSILQADIEYNKRATQRLLEASSALTPAELVFDLKQSHRSILQTLNHYFDSEQFWSECLLTSSMPPIARIGDSGDPPMLPLEELKSEWARIWEILDGWIAPLAEEQLPGQFLARCLPVESFNFPHGN